MKKRIFRTVTGFCPIVNNDKTIELEYSELLKSGSLNEHYKAVNLKCDSCRQCTEKYCPIMKSNITIEI